MWHKYLAELCNTNIDGTWGRFIGPEESYVNVTLKEKSVITSQHKPLIILPSGTLSFGDKIVVKNRPWLVQEYDDISTDGITYYSLTPTTVSKDLETTIEHTKKEYQTNEQLENNVVAHNINITITTEDGYFKYSNPNLKVISRTVDNVVFNLPFGVDKVVVYTKQNDSIIETTYEAK